MTASLTWKKSGALYYLKKGRQPILLLISGTHGDEYGVIEPLKKIVEKYSDRLPDFIFIPDVSPSAIKLKTRRNKFGHDVNRKFFGDTDDIEAKSVMKIVAKHQFKLGISFHEDWEYDSFYIYDSEQMDSNMLNNFKTNIKKLGVGLYSGIDDIHDVELGSSVRDGYVVDPADLPKLAIGDFWHWSLVNGYVERLLYPEIPSALTIKNKLLLIDLIFKDLIFPLLNLH